MSVTLGKYRSTTAAGWTEILPSADSILIYVDPDNGSDSNDGLSHATAVQTISHAISLTTNGHPDWILIKEGTTITGDVASGGLFGNNGFPLRKGRSATEPFVFTSYSSTGIDRDTAPRGTVRGAPPQLRGWSSSADLHIFGQNIANQLDYVAMIGLDIVAYKNDPNDPGYDVDAFGVAGIDIVFACTWILFEDVHLRGCGFNFNQTNGTVILGRCSVARHITSLGCYLEKFNSILVEGNVFDLCGWDGAGTRSGNNHNVYGQVTNGASETWIYRGNISTRGSYDAFKCRHGGLLDNNLMSQNQEGFDYGSGNSDVAAHFGPSSIINNVILRSQGSFPNAIGIQAVNRPTDLSRNLIAHADSGEPVGISLKASSANVTGSGNVILDHGTTINDIGSGNALTGTVTSTTGMEDPSYTLDDYAVSLGLADEEAFIAAALANRRYNWDHRLTAPYANNVIRSKYGMEAVEGSIHRLRLSVSAA